MSETKVKPRTPDEVGVPDPMLYMHPLLKKNYGNWDWHERPRPGVLHHVAKGGDSVWTVRAGTQRQMDVGTIRKLCDIADEYAEGHVRFTTRTISPKRRRNGSSVSRNSQKRRQRWRRRNNRFPTRPVH